MQDLTVLVVNVERRGARRDGERGFTESQAFPGKDARDLKY